MGLQRDCFGGTITFNDLYDLEIMPTNRLLDKCLKATKKNNQQEVDELTRKFKETVDLIIIAIGCSPDIKEIPPKRLKRIVPLHFRLRIRTEMHAIRKEILRVSQAKS